MSLTLNTWDFTADGNGEWFSLNHRRHFTLAAFGTFGGGTVTAEVSPDGGTSVVAIADISATDDYISGQVHLPQGYSFRPVVAGSTTPTITVKITESVV